MMSTAALFFIVTKKKNWNEPNCLATDELWYIQTTLYSKANEQILLKIQSDTNDLHKHVEIRDKKTHV